MPPDSYDVRPATRMDCGRLVSDVHYANRWPSVTHIFGLYLDDKLQGVVTFGTPSSSPLRTGLAGPEYAKNVLELNRLVLYHNRKNEASRLISGALRLLRLRGNFVVISFADTEQGHVGTIYQACNFGYYGLSEKRTDWKVKGLEHIHGQTIADEFRGKPNRSKLMRDKYGDDFYLKERPRKHRYIIAIGHRKFVKAATSAIKYEKREYPSNETNPCPT